MQEVFDELAARTGRRYALVEYRGAPDAERVVVLMGSAAGAASEAVDALVGRGRAGRHGHVRLYRPVPGRGASSRALPPTCRSVAVLDRTKEPGAVGEPLYLDVRAALDRGDGRRRAAVRRAARGSSAGATACRPRSSRRRW